MSKTKGPAAIDVRRLREELVELERQELDQPRLALAAELRAAREAKAEAMRVIAEETEAARLAAIQHWTAAARGPGQAAKDRDAALAAKGADWAFARFMPTAAEVARARRAGKKVLLVGAPVTAAPPASMPS
jgi:hypothetical protein